MIDFLILYEVEVRELESIFMLGLELQKRGYTVDYLSFNNVSLSRYVSNRKVLKKFFNNVDTVLVPSLYHDLELYNLVYYVCGEAKHVVNLRWEQYFSNKQMNDRDSYLFPHGDAVNAKFLCWGKKSYDSLISSGVNPDNLYITGPIQMDLLRPQYINYFFKRAELFEQYNISASSTVLLFISSFVAATQTIKQIESGEKDFEGKKERDNKNIEFAKKTYQLMIEWIEDFMRQNPQVTFIYRPHPCENLTNEIKSIEKRFDGFKIISDYSVKQWIITCDKVVTWISTSIAEAFFSGVDCYIVRPLPYDYDNDVCYYQGASFITEKNDFLNLLKDNNVKSSINKEIIYEYYDYQKVPSYLRSADCVEKIKNSNDFFCWDSQKTQTFEKSRFKYFCHSALLVVYFRILDCLVFISRLSGVKYPQFIASRIENYKIFIKKDDVKHFNIVKSRIAEVMDCA